MLDPNEIETYTTKWSPKEILFAIVLTGIIAGFVAGYLITNQL